MAVKAIIKPQVADFIRDLDADDRVQIVALIKVLEEVGAMLGPPQVKRINHANTHNMKELRKQTNAKHFRILFAFDANRAPVLLYAGNKKEIGWTEFYDVGIPKADDLFAAHKKALADSKKAKGKVSKAAKPPRKKRRG